MDNNNSQAPYPLQNTLPPGFDSPVLDRSSAAKFVGFKDSKAFDKCVAIGIMPKPLKYLEHGIDKHLWLIEDLYAALRKLSSSRSTESNMKDQIRERINARKN